MLHAPVANQNDAGTNERSKSTEVAKTCLRTSD